MKESRPKPLGTTAFVAFLGAVFALPSLVGISMLDEGTIVHVADRIASGEVLYRDIATGVMPGSFYLQAVLFAVFGRSLLVGRVFMILIFAAASATVFLVGERVSSRATGLLAALSFIAVSVHYWRFPGYSSEAIFVILLTLAATRAFIDSRHPKWLLLTGLGLGVGILFKQNYGVFASLGVGVGLLAAAPNLRRALGDVLTATIGSAMPIALTAGLFAWAGAASEFWDFTVRVPLSIPFTDFAKPWPPLLSEPEAGVLRDILYYLPFEELILDAKGWLGQQEVALDATELLLLERLAYTGVQLVYYLPPFCLVASGFFWVSRQVRLRREQSPMPSEASRQASGALFLATSVFLFLGVFPRVDAHHLFIVLAPCFPLGAWLLGPSPHRLVLRSTGVACGALVGLSAISQYATVAAVHPEEVRDAFLETPRARVWVERWQAEEIREQLERIWARVPDGEPIFAAPSIPMYYFLADRPNPSRYPLILPGALDEAEVITALEDSAVQYALISDIAFDHFPFQHIAPSVWNYLVRHFRPAEGAGWDVAPFAPYLYERGRPTPPRPEQASNAAGSGARVENVSWTEVHDLVAQPLSAAPIFQTVSKDDWRNWDRYRVEWQSTYLEPTLVMRAPGAWRKVLVSWEVPAGGSYGFEIACTLAPWGWGTWVDGQGALVEIWVGSDGAPPRRMFMRWLNPRDVASDRRWHRAIIDLSFVREAKAVVSLVVGPAPTFVEADATVAWSVLSLVKKNHDAPTEREVPTPRNVRVSEATTRHLLGFQPQDLAIFRESSRRYPDLGKSHIALAEVAASLGRHEVALSAARSAVRVDPANPHGWMRLAQELEHAGRLVASIEAIEAAIEREPANANYRAALAAARLSEPGEDERAREDALAALDLDPENTWAWTLLAKAEERLGNLEAALEAGERSVELAPNEAWPRLTVAASLLALGRPEDALRELEKAAHFTMDSGARAELARIHLACGRVERARSEAIAAMDSDPSSLGALTVLGHAEVASERWESAIATWRELARLDPESPAVRVQLARSLGRAGRTDEALDAISAAAALAEGDPSRLREVAIVMDELGAAEARSTWRRVLALAPEGELKDEARRRLASPQVKRAIYPIALWR